MGPVPLSTADERKEAFSRLRDYTKSLPHAEAMTWVAEVCDELGAAPQPSAVLGWDDLRRLAEEGVTLGAHTQTHPLLNRITPEEVRAEAEGSLSDLQREIGDILPILAYPSGGFNAEVVERVQQAGIQMAFTTDMGLNDWRQLDALRLRRINVGWRTPLVGDACPAAVLGALRQLSGAQGLAEQLKQPSFCEKLGFCHQRTVCPYGHWLEIEARGGRRGRLRSGGRSGGGGSLPATFVTHDQPQVVGF